ncbi:hypothetical protein PFY10_20025 [Chryseobacterium daecheongense]|nr:hypothetical protein PFY10_20025 [Chryseobacterium daecheongense]
METIAELVDYLQNLGYTFRQSESGSFYCNERRIRVSNHFSKYVEKMEQTFGDTDAIDFVFHLDTKYTVEDVEKRLNKTLWFSKLKQGVSIQHSLFERVGKIVYISHNEEKEFVTVSKENGEIVNYDFYKIRIL